MLIKSIINYHVWRTIEQEEYKKVGYSKVQEEKDKSIFLLIWRAASSQPIPTIFGISSEVADVIKCAKFHVDRL